ncbi:hypothetical protein JG688_00016865 [Phytophthora aleatoria]|uniref:Uncharacterized protein n=1 Tax=Phytophthora aleatoria TaxID=2496075 RepID=A0A8J5LVT9_9STRA|nr:hypothetical protein JG688_00016865 [Phytophthora aleatoria]
MEQLWLSRSKPNGRTNASTKLHHPDTIDSSTNTICVPLPKDAVLAFFGHICSSVTSTECMQTVPPALLCLCPVFGDTGAQKWTFSTLNGLSWTHN